MFIYDKNIYIYIFVKVVSLSLYYFDKDSRLLTSCGLSPVGVGNLGLFVIFNEVCGSWFVWSDWLRLSDWLRESNSSSSASKSEWLKQKYYFFKYITYLNT